MGFSEIDAQQIADVGCEYSNLLGYQLGQPPRHLFLGYADYVQDITPAVQEQNLALLFQVASDNHTMCWGDGGYLYFFIKPENLDPLDLYGVVGDYQSG